MAQGIRPGEEQNARDVYADIIDLPGWEPNSRHPRMSMEKRAAQFAPFAALSGYEEMISEEFRATNRQIELAEDDMRILDRKLNRIAGIIAGGTHPEAAVTYFIPDTVKDGGRYHTVTARIRQIDPAGGRLILYTKDPEEIPESIRIDRILDIQGEAAEDPEDFF